MLNKFLDPLKHGQCLHDPAFWKKLQTMVNLGISILPVIAVFIPALQQYVTAELLAKVYVALGAMNIYFTTATSEKVGV